MLDFIEFLLSKKAHIKKCLLINPVPSKSVVIPSEARNLLIKGYETRPKNVYVNYIIKY